MQRSAIPALRQPSLGFASLQPSLRELLHSRIEMIMNSRIKCAIVGSGNIGTDLMYKLQRSERLEPVWMVGIEPTSEGLARAKKMGLKTTDKGVDGLVPHVKNDGVQIAFDATSAYVHKSNSDKLTALGVMMIDL